MNVAEETAEVGPASESAVLESSTAPARRQYTIAAAWFVVAVFGFSFWFLLAVPFASHRETYGWLALVHSEEVSSSLGFISSTYRPLFQITTWVAFLALDPNVFPTSVPRQVLFQMSIYAFFVYAWWLMYSAAPQKRLFALTGLLAGGF